GIAGHAVKVRAGFRIAEVSEIACDMDGGNQGTYRSKFANHDQRNQMGKYVEKVRRFFAENILAIRIEKYKSEEFAIEVHWHGVARAITLLCDTPGMFVQAFSKYRQIIHNTRRTAFQYF